MPPDVSILIVTYNSSAVISECLASIAAGTRLAHEIILVDNASQDDTVALVRERYPAVRLIANCRNLGFAAAVNQASRVAQGEYYQLLNPDTIVHTQAIDLLAACLHTYPEAGLCVPRSLYADGQLRTNCFPFSGPGRFFSEAVFIGPGQWLRRFFLAPPSWQLSADAVQPVEAAAGAALLIRAALFQQLGGLDERFFMYYEDFDFCRRARAAGRSTLYVPSAVITHFGGHSVAADTVRLHGMNGPLGLAAQYQYVAKHAGKLAAHGLRLAYGLAGLVIWGLGAVWPDAAQRRRAARYGRLLAQTPFPYTPADGDGKANHCQEIEDGDGETAQGSAP